MGRLDHFEKSNAFIMEATAVTLSTSAEIETAIYLDPVDVGRFVDTDRASDARIDLVEDESLRNLGLGHDDL